MTQHIGNVNWLNDNGYGGIRDDQGRDYYFHNNVLLPGALGSLANGKRMTFKSRPHPTLPGRMEAYDLFPANSTSQANDPAWKTATEQAHSSPAADAQTVLEAAAAEVLRFKLARLEATTVSPVDPLRRDAAVEHPDWGSGRVVLSTGASVTIEFLSGKIQSFSRSVLTNALATSNAFFRKSTATFFTDFVDNLRSETCAELLDEGFDTQHIYRCEEPKEAEAGVALEDLDERVRHAFAQEGITEFYSHQIAAYDALRKKRSIVLCTPTASGKTASFTPAILGNLLQERGGTALYVFPLVALAADQTGKLCALNKHLPKSDQLRIGVLNSSVATAEKDETKRSYNQIVVTTPDTLHYQLLPNSYPNWVTFFKNLRYLVLDEAHIYKGAFGSNVANIVRRVVARCFRLSGRMPQIVIASATVRDPCDLAVRLTGYKPDCFDIIDHSGARTPRRHLLITREPVQELCKDLLSVVTRDEATNKTRPVRVIVFTRSIQAARSGCSRLRAYLEKNGRANLASHIADYYSDKSDKNDTFERLRNGGIQCIFSTTALMAGIDIGSLDVVIVDGFPGLVMDARQMFGRAGRASEGAAIFIAHRGDPFDDFYLQNPDLLFKGSTEAVIANPENPLLLAAHMLCASLTTSVSWENEGPLAATAVHLFGESGDVVINAFEHAGQIELLGNSIYNRSGKPHSDWPLADLRATNDKDPLVLKVGSDGRELEKKRRALAFRDTHPGATFIHDGKKYKVVRFPVKGDSSNLILCEPVEPDPGFWTQGVEEFRISIEEILKPERGIGEFYVALGRVQVHTDVAAYWKIQNRHLVRCSNRRCRHESPNTKLEKCPKCGSHLRTYQIDKIEPTPTPIQGDYDLTTKLPTQAAWIDLKQGLITTYNERFWPRWQLTSNDARVEEHPAFPCAVASTMSAVLKVFPECANCDRDDIGAVHEQVDSEWRIYFYDQFPQGLGISAEFAREPKPYLDTALTMLERCSCTDEGCPVCMHNYRSRQQSVLSKLSARFLLRIMLGLNTREVLDDLQNKTALMAPSSVIHDQSTTKPENGV